MTAGELTSALWRDYVATTPQAERIQRLLADLGERVVHDHIALRTYALPGFGIAGLAQAFAAAGWRAGDRHPLDDKIVGQYWQHDDASLPKLLITELRVSELSAAANMIIDRLVAQLPPGFATRPDLAWAGRAWNVRRAEYESLRFESEYAAYVAAFGFRVHHFTVAMSSLTTFPDLQSVNAFLVEHGFSLDANGSTRPDAVPVAFADTTMRVPSGCYVFKP